MAYTIKSFGEFWEPLGRLEVRLDAGLYDLFRGLRSLLLATHWHTFTLMYTGLPLRRDAADILRSPPLLPRFIPLREDAARHAIFRLLSDVSHSTKGVVLLMMDGHTTKRVMDEAQKLNMVLGNFVWLWIDTTATISAHNDSKLSIFYPEDTSRSKDRRARESGDNDHPTTGVDYISYIFKYLLGERIVSSNFTSNSSGVNGERSVSGFKPSDNSDMTNSSKDFNTNNSLTSTNGLSSTMNNKTKTYIRHAEQYNISSENTIRVNGNTDAPSRSKDKIVSDPSKQSISSLRLLKNTTIANDFVWIPSRRKLWSGINSPQNQMLDLVHNIPLSMNLVENSNVSIILGSLGSIKSNNESDNRLSGRKVVTRSARNRDSDNLKASDISDKVPALPVGMLGVRAVPLRFDRHLVRSVVKLLVESLRRTFHRKCRLKEPTAPEVTSSQSCWHSSPAWQRNFSHYLVRYVQSYIVVFD
ncbi:Glutamate receptor ionotropic, NMDA 3A [Homalodisca vitripennis]|nr:Glutamate receptor ionotropic, NMDA 3A [Homalodisca vitripennis]